MEQLKLLKTPQSPEANDIALLLEVLSTVRAFALTGNDTDLQIFLLDTVFDSLRCVGPFFFFYEILLRKDHSRPVQVHLVNIIAASLEETNEVPINVLNKLLEQFLLPVRLFQIRLLLILFCSPQNRSRHAMLWPFKLWLGWVPSSRRA